MTTGISGDHLARFQAQLKSYGDRIYELERRLRIKQTALGRPAAPAPHARLTHGSAVPIPHGVETVVSFANQPEATVGGMKSGNRLVAPKAGVYTVSCGIKWDFQNLLGETILHVLNPADSYVFIDDHVTFPVPLFFSENTSHGSWTGILSAGTQIEARVYQRNSASADRSVVVYGAYPYFSLTYQGAYV